MHEKEGTLLMLLLHDIAHNFAPEDRTATQLVKSLILLKDLLIESGEIESNFIFAVCKAKR